ncbi:polysulfide reductase NrfD [Candidatus Magnetoovum chiemensis]|nr:polysulfide reductase NrfD [Candidatus Magnetoovum chiemensis]
MKEFLTDLGQRLIRSQNPAYYIWVFFLLFITGMGGITYISQAANGLIVTAMRDQVSWGFYIANFTFLVGVAAAAVLLVIPAYLYNFKPIKEIVLFGEMIAVTAIVMCIMFVMADMGRPQYAWHILMSPNFPSSLLVWDVIVLNGYLFINAIAVFYIVFHLAQGKKYSMAIMWPIVIISIPWAISIHTVTAFLYNGLSSRPFWNASIIAPRFIASALCSGPALILLIFQIIRKVSKIDVTDRAIFLTAELISYTMAVNLYLFSVELFKEFYSQSMHLAPMEYLFFGLHGHDVLNPYIWTAVTCNITAFVLFLNRKTRENFLTLNIACLLIIVGVYLEKGMGLIIPGFVPSTLGEIYDYLPTMAEIKISAAIWASGALLYTLLLRVVIPIYSGDVRLTIKKPGRI